MAPLKMYTLDGLLPFLDNGGRRSYVERRISTKKYSINERALTADRRNILDRRKRLNLIRKNSPERRFFYRDQSAKPVQAPARLLPLRRKK